MPFKNPTCLAIVGGSALSLVAYFTLPYYIVFGMSLTDAYLSLLGHSQHSHISVALTIISLEPVVIGAILLVAIACLLRPSVRQGISFAIMTCSLLLIAFEIYQAWPVVWSTNHFVDLGIGYVGIQLGLVIVFVSSVVSIARSRRSRSVGELLLSGKA